MNEDDKSKDTKLETINNKMVEVLKTIQSKQFTKDINNLEYLKRNKGKAVAVLN